MTHSNQKGNKMPRKYPVYINDLHGVAMDKSSALKKKYDLAVEARKVIPRWKIIKRHNMALQPNCTAAANNCKKGRIEE